MVYVNYTEREKDENGLWNSLFLQPNARFLSKRLFILYDMIYIINDEIHFKGSDLHIYKMVALCVQRT